MNPLRQQFNDILATAASQMPLRTAGRPGTGTFITQWTVTAEKQGNAQDFGINPLSGEAYFSASVFKAQPPDLNRLWRIEVGEGCINGTPAQIATLPLSEDPAPGLIATTPSADLASLGDFQRVPDEQRPKYYRTAEAWDADLFRASVYVEGVVPFRADAVPDFALLDLALIPSPTLVGLLSGIAVSATLASIGLTDRLAMLPLLPPYKIHVGSIPFNLDGLEQFRLAWLYLLRRPGADPRLDSLEIQQLCFWNLAAWSLLEDFGELELAGLIATTGIVGAITTLDIVQAFLDSANIRWWTR